MRRFFVIFVCSVFAFSRAAPARDDSDFKPDSLPSIKVQDADSPEFFSPQVANITPSEYSNSTHCPNPVRGQCSFYEDCLEPRYHCGADGYPVGFGKKYCNKFNAAKDGFSEEGQKWMLDTMECLQLALVPEVDESKEVHPKQQGGSPCDLLKTKAFGSHAQCYLESGFCALGLRDRMLVLKIVELKTLFESWEALKGALEATAGCLADSFE